MKYLNYLLLLLTVQTAFAKTKRMDPVSFFTANDTRIQYTGRIDFSDPLKPKFWSPGVYIKAKFKGTECELVINDEELYGNSHNYIEIVIDSRPPVKIQTTGKVNNIVAAHDLQEGEHTITICKDTESGIGYLEFVGLKCERLLPLSSRPKRKIEYIGDSITAGSSLDLSIPCNTGKWYDQHNAYMSYGAVTSRKLNAQYHISAVSGIGLIHSCCNMKTVMPQVFDKLSLRGDSLKWDFSKYQPDVVTVCLGQNDGIQDSIAFCSAYVKFLGTIRSHYPKTTIICLTSPMADEKLTAVLKNYLTGIIASANKNGDQQVFRYFFSKRYFHGCGTHPNMAEHQQIANALAVYIRKIKSW